MSSRVESGRSWQPSSAGAFVVPAALVLFGLVGVTSGPLLDLRGARQSYRAAAELVEEYALERERLAELEAWPDGARVEELARELDRLLPANLGPLEAFTVARLAARDSGLALQAIDLGPVYDLVAEIDGETVYMQELRLSAEDEPLAVLRFLASLRSSGYPTAVLELTLARHSPTAAVFHARLNIGLLYRGAPIATPTAESFDDLPDEPLAGPQRP